MRRTGEFTLAGIAAAVFVAWSANLSWAQAPPAAGGPEAGVSVKQGAQGNAELDVVGEPTIDSERPGPNGLDTQRNAANNALRRAGPDLSDTGAGANADLEANAPMNRERGANDIDWRYRRHNGEWWYWLPSGRWVFYRNGIWNPYVAAQFVRPEIFYGAQNGYYRNGYYDGNRYYGDRYYRNGYQNGYYPYSSGYRGIYNQQPIYRYPNTYRGSRAGSAIGGAVGGGAGANLGGAIGGAAGNAIDAGNGLRGTTPRRTFNDNQPLDTRQPPLDEEGAINRPGTLRGDANGTFNREGGAAGDNRGNLPATTPGIRETNPNVAPRGSNSGAGTSNPSTPGTPGAAPGTSNPSTPTAPSPSSSGAAGGAGGGPGGA